MAGKMGIFRRRGTLRQASVGLLERIQAVIERKELELAALRKEEQRLKERLEELEVDD